jgi:two-component system, cell cycle response regulator CtrA
MEHVTSVFQIGGVTVDLDAHSVQVGSQILHLTRKEYAVLKLLIVHRGAVVPKSMFLDNLYATRNIEPESRIIVTMVSRLRKKLTEATGGQDYIKTIWGLGYMLPRDEKMPSSVTDIAKAPVG